MRICSTQMRVLPGQICCHVSFRFHPGYVRKVMNPKNFRNWYVFASILLTFCCYSAFGQAVFGNIIGTVTDPSGAAVPSANVTITDADRGTTYQTKSNPSGYYEQT